MGKVKGPISDRLRKQFKKDDPVWTPQRVEEPPPSPEALRRAEGHELFGRNKKP